MLDSQAMKYCVCNMLEAMKYNTIQLYCLCVEKFAFWLVIYIKHSIYLSIKHQQLNVNETWS